MKRLALVALGFSKKIAQQKIDKALTNKQGNFDVETLVRELKPDVMN